MVKTLPPSCSVASAPGDAPSSRLLPSRLPPADAPERWAFLQALRRTPPPLEAWVRAITAGEVAPHSDLLAALADHLDPASVLQLLRWWGADPVQDPGLPERILKRRDPALAAHLRDWVQRDGDGAIAQVVLPLLGHQRQPGDFTLLRHTALAPVPTPVRRAALEGLLRGLSAWPVPALRATLMQLAQDLDPSLAACAVDGLARVAGSRAELMALRSQPLETSVARRLERRLRERPPAPLLLLVHGRSGGLIPAELTALAHTLEERRGSPVRLLALTASGTSRPQAEALALPSAAWPQGQEALALVPLLLLPGQHVRADLPALAAALKGMGPVRCWPFLGSWPSWQRSLAEEVNSLETGGLRPLLLHHPLEGPLAARYLRHLAAVCATQCRATPYASPLTDGCWLEARPVLPLTLAANRLTESLEPWLGEAAARPLLLREGMRRRLLTLLTALP